MTGSDKFPFFRFNGDISSGNDHIINVAEFYLDTSTCFSFIYLDSDVFKCRLDVANLFAGGGPFKGKPFMKMRDINVFNFGEIPCVDLGEVDQGAGSIVPRYSLLEDKGHLVLYERQMTGVTNVFTVCNKLEYSLMRAKTQSLRRKNNGTG
jgi:hypothetical protein